MATKKNSSTKVDRNSIITIIYSILSVLVVYLIQHPKILNLQLWPRYMTLAATIFIFALLFLTQAKRYKNTINNSLWRNPLFLSYGGLALVMVISLVNTINISEGLMDSSKYLLMFFYFALSLTIFNTENGYKIVAKVATLTMLGLLVWAFAQYIPNYLRNLNGGVRDMDDVRVNFVRSNQFCIGGFLLMPFLLFQYFQKEKIWTTLAIIAIYGNLFFTISIQTRSVWAAFVLGFIVVGIIFFLSGKKQLGELYHKRILRKIIIMAATAVVMFVFAEGLAHYYGNASSSVTQSVEKTFDSTQQFGAFSRLRRWKATLKLVEAKPLLGEGAGDWKTMKYKYGLYDNSVTPHNDYLWVLSDAGIIGFAFYMTLFILAFIFLHRAYHRAESKEDKLMALCLLFGLVGYMAIQSFTFPKKGISHQVMLTLFFVFSIILNSKVTAKSKGNIPKWLFRTALIAILLITPVMIAFGYVRLKSEKNERIALAFRAKADHKNVIKYMKLANNKWSNIDAFNHSISSYIGESYYYLEENETAIKYYSQALRESPYNTNYWVNRSMAFSKMGLFDKSMADLNMALSINPKYQLAHTNKAVILFNDKKYDEALEVLYTLLELNPKAGKAHYMLGLISLNRKQNDDACTSFQLALKYKFTEAQKFVDAYCPKETAPEK